MKSHLLSYRIRPHRLVAVVLLGAVCIGMSLDSFGQEEPSTRASQAGPDQAGPDRAGPDQAGLDFFETKIRPVLVGQCYECHSASRKASKGGLRLDTRDRTRSGGDSGPAVVPHRVKDSLLIDALRQESFEMPPSGKLPRSVIADFERWIALGAPDPRDGGQAVAQRDAIADAAREFWSLRPHRNHRLPKVGDRAWPRTPIDQFLLARLEDAGLRSTVDADKVTMVRRIFFDLLGLPPTPSEIDAFVGDDSPDAFERLVDNLLSSPHFGERWGRHWLDVVRYADSSGGGRTRIFEDSWRYRDYVLNSFNLDRPYNTFVAEQVAGDLLPAESPRERARKLTATGFLVLGPTNYELQDKDLLRMEVVDEQIDTMGRAVLGMTIGCARCHDHKFDPIPTADYYALAGIFRSTKTLTPGNVSGFVQTPLPLPPDQQRARERFEHQAKPVREQLAAAQQDLKQLQDRLTGGRKPLDPAALPGIVVDETKAQLEGDWKSSTSIKPYVGDSYHFAPSGTSIARFETNLAKAGRYEVRISHTASSNRATNVPVTVQHADGQTRRQLNHRQSPPDGLFVSLGQFQFNAGPTTVTLHCDGLNGLAIADAVQWLPLDVPSGNVATRTAESSHERTGPSAEESALIRRELKDRRQELQRTQQQLKKLEATAPPAAGQVMSVRDETETGDYYVCIRGNIRNQGEPVRRGFLGALTDAGPPVISSGQSGRLELAQWLASADNRLTARVFVNRVWLHLIGEGLVRTPDNFGTMGGRPSHPELLDYLALKFIRDGWSVKRLVRGIVLSRVYGLSSTAPSADTDADPENRLLARMHYRRLDAESIRDLILAVSGQLDRTVGGSLIPVGTKSEFGFRFEEGRRSVYLPVFRNRLHGLMEVFDFADPNLVSGRRNTSTLPTQSLYLMNSPFIMEQAELAADRLLREAVTDNQRIELLYRRALGRMPSPTERQLTLDYLDQLLGSDPPATANATRRTAWATVCQALFASLDFRYLK